MFIKRFETFSFCMLIASVAGAAQGTSSTSASPGSVVEKLQQAVERVVAIGQDGQLCSAELDRLQAERARLDKEGRESAINLPKMLSEHYQLVSSKAVPKAQLDAALAELEKIDRRLRAKPTQDGFAKELRDIDAEIREQEACIAEAKKRLGRYDKPVSTPAKPK